VRASLTTARRWRDRDHSGTLKSARSGCPARLAQCTLGVAQVGLAGLADGELRPGWPDRHEVPRVWCEVCVHGGGIFDQNAAHQRRASTLAPLFALTLPGTSRQSTQADSKSKNVLPRGGDGSAMEQRPRSARSPRPPCTRTRQTRRTTMQGWENLGQTRAAATTHAVCSAWHNLGGSRGPLHNSARGTMVRLWRARLVSVCMARFSECPANAASLCAVASEHRVRCRRAAA
jgi:hypothetical protein